MVCNQPTRWQLTPQSQADAVWRQSTELSPFPCLQIKEKWQAILAEQKDKVIWGQPVVGLDPNCSIHGVLSHSVVSDSLWPYGLQLARLFCSWNFPGKDTVVGCHFLFPRKLPLPDPLRIEPITLASPTSVGSFFTTATITPLTPMKSLLCASESCHVKSWSCCYGHYTKSCLWIDSQRVGNFEE